MLQESAGLVRVRIPSSTKGLIDSGASAWMTPDRNVFETLQLLPKNAGHVVYLADNRTAPIHGVGDIVYDFDGHKRRIRNALYIPDLVEPLFDLAGEVSAQPMDLDGERASRSIYPASQHGQSDPPANALKQAGTGEEAEASEAAIRLIAQLENETGESVHVAEFRANVGEIAAFPDLPHQISTKSDFPRAASEIAYNGQWCPPLRGSRLGSLTQAGGTGSWRGGGGGAAGSVVEGVPGAPHICLVPALPPSRRASNVLTTSGTVLALDGEIESLIDGGGTGSRVAEDPVDVASGLGILKESGGMGSSVGMWALTRISGQPCAEDSRRLRAGRVPNRLALQAPRRTDSKNFCTPYLVVRKNLLAFLLLVLFPQVLDGEEDENEDDEATEKAAGGEDEVWVPAAAASRLGARGGVCYAFVH
ncbi:hypothetical protein HDU96_009127 [Phlyctochytrium bullatum]|nr:hypothetical protein HDU96_009127 [Phlyctochytrium bullatum]